MKSRGLVINNPCNKCGKMIRHDYNGVCMDCADELGISEYFDKSANYGDNLAKAKKWFDGGKERQPRDSNLFDKELSRIKSGTINSDNFAFYATVDKSIVTVVEGESGYHSTGIRCFGRTQEEVEKMVEQKNLARGVSPELADAIVAYSMFPNIKNIKNFS